MNEIRLLHTADVHIGAPFGFLGTKAGEQKRAQREALERIVTLARDKGYHALLVAGDLFHAAFVPEESQVSLVASLLAGAGSSCRVVILPGGHDRWIPGSVFERSRERFESRGNVHILSPDRATVEFPDISLAVHGRALTSREGCQRPFEGLSARKSSRWNVCLAHGTVDGAGWPIESGETTIRLADLPPGFDYVALGHWHSYFAVPGSAPPAVYSGSPEVVARDQRGAGAVVSVTLSDGPPRIERLPVGRRRVERVAVDCTGARTMEDLVERVASAAPPDPDVILELSFTGIVGLEAAFDPGEVPAAIAERYFSVRLSGTGPSRELPREALAATPADTIAGTFINAMLKKIDEASADERPLYEEALQLGVHLLGGRDVLG